MAGNENFSPPVDHEKNEKIQGKKAEKQLPDFSGDPMNISDDEEEPLSSPSPSNPIEIADPNQFNSKRIRLANSDPNVFKLIAPTLKRKDTPGEKQKETPAAESMVIFNIKYMTEQETMDMERKKRLKLALDVLTGTIKTKDFEKIAHTDRTLSEIDDKLEQILTRVQGNEKTQLNTNWAKVAAREPKPGPAQAVKPPKKESKLNIVEKKQKARLIVKTDEKISSEIFTPREIRDEINIAAKQTAVASVSLSKNGNIILHANKGFTAEDLHRNKNTWVPVLHKRHKVKEVQNDESWTKIVLHSVSTDYFDKEDGMDDLKMEIETYNNVKIMGLPRWLTSDRKREGKAHSSVILSFKTEQEALYARRAGISILGVTVKSSVLRSRQPMTQCNKCQKHGHYAVNCERSAKCRYCAGNHETKIHTCSTCSVIGSKCSHTALRCVNCNGAHQANDPRCKVSKHTADTEEDEIAQ
jgi:hypothetical protein